MVDDGEECDDGEESADCNADCSAAACGDGVTNAAAGEACDDGAESETCNIDCSVAECGDGVVNATAGEECDGEGRSADCNADCTTSSCGDGVTNAEAGEACDDEGESAACNVDCSAAVCGDGQINETAGEQCDDENGDDDDGCSATCQVESGGRVFLTSSNGSEGFYGYDIDADTWETLTSPPSVTRSQLANDGTNVFLLGADDTIYSYDLDGDSWSAGIAGPGATVANPIGFFQWFPDGFYYLQDGTATMSVYRDAAWSTFELDVTGSSAGSYDAATGELYIRQYSQAGFRVIDTADDTTVRMIDDTTSVGENSRTGTYYGGNFYVRTSSGPILRLDSTTGAATDTTVTPVSNHTGTDVDVVTGLLYISGYNSDATSFQVFDTNTDTLTTLADQPSVSNHSTITVLRPSL